MSLFISAQLPASDKKLELEVPTEDKYYLEWAKNNIEQIVSVQADGHELQQIKDHFSGLPMHNGRVVEWFGDDAKFVVRHFV